ncbi:MAG: hypothetical protein U1G08_18855 [Verrucomicrobiota bacterium]
MTKTKSKPLKSAATLREAAAALGEPLPWVREACHVGKARSAGGRINLAVARRWISQNRGRLSRLRTRGELLEQKLSEEVRKLRIRNDREAALLVDRGWVTERHGRLAGEMSGIRAKSEQEDAMLFIGTNGDIARCRQILRGIWDRIFKSMQGCARHFEQ